MQKFKKYGKIRNVASQLINNPIIEDLNDSEKGEISNIKLKRMIIKIKEDVCKHLNEFKESANKELNEMRTAAQDKKGNLIKI
jgi:hypothetical protein